MSGVFTLLSPLNLLFLIIGFGLLIGKARISGISFGIAGVLFLALLSGFLLTLLPQAADVSSINSTMNIFSRLGSSLFISVIGLQTGFSVKNKSPGVLRAFAIGVIVSLSGVMAMLCLRVVDQNTSDATLWGVLCGALTSSPGLSNVCELIDGGGDEAVWGYGCAYLFGVLVAVMFTKTIIPKGCGSIASKFPSPIQKHSHTELVLVCFTALPGNILSTVLSSLSNISVGATFCTLTVALFVGYIVKRNFSKLNVSLFALNTFRNFGLALFFAGTGFTTGTQITHIDLKTILYGMIISLSAILCGWLCGQVLFAPYKQNLAFVLAGGMTSSPAYGAINAHANESSDAHFSFAYLGALITLIISVQILVR